MDLVDVHDPEEIQGEGIVFPDHTYFIPSLLSEFVARSRSADGPTNCCLRKGGVTDRSVWRTMDVEDLGGHLRFRLSYFPSGYQEGGEDLVIADPSLTTSAPPTLTSLSGLDALTHATEAYASLWRNDFSDALAVKAVKLIFQYLPRAVEDPDDMEAREGMQNAALMAGYAFGNSHCGMAHALGHAVGAVLE